MHLPCSWGLAADRFQAHRPIIFVCLIVSSVSRCMLLVAKGFKEILTLILLVQVWAAPVWQDPCVRVLATGALPQGLMACACKKSPYTASAARLTPAHINTNTGDGQPCGAAG